MKTIGKTILLSVLAATLASCNAFAPQATATPVPTATSAPTLTHTPEPTGTPTQEPTQTPVPPTETPSAPDLPMPSGEPSTEWEGIPVMPNAIAGEGDSTGYSFTIKATAEEIQSFYETELAKLGWGLFTSGQGASGATLLMFMKDVSIVSVSIIPQPDGVMYVLLVK